MQTNRTKRFTWAALGAGIAAAATWLFPNTRPAASTVAVAPPIVRSVGVAPPLMPRATAVVVPAASAINAVPPPVTAPYTDPHFGNDRLRNTDGTLLETYLYPPLETTGKTYANEHTFQETDGAAPSSPTEHYHYVRLRVIATRDSAATAVHLGGIKFFWGMLSLSEPMTIWNPHTGERTHYTAGTPWSDDDQREVVFHFAEPVAFNRYQFKTSTQSPIYDPVRWTLEASKNGAFWVTLDAKTETPCAIPLERGASVNFLIRPRTPT